MKNINRILLVALLAFICLNVHAQEYVTQTKESLTNMTPQDALQKLKDGNERFLSGKLVERNLNEQVKQTAHGQYPFAIVLSCMDSRSPSEFIFDQGIGDIFNDRVAGNVVDEDILGSLEFACKITGSKLILVLGHTNCGAIKGACDDVKMGNLTNLLSKIKPAIEAVPIVNGERNSKNKDFVDKVSKENVFLAIQNINDRSPILKEMIDKGEIKIVGAMYDVETGKVTFYE